MKLNSFFNNKKDTEKDIEIRVLSPDTTTLKSAKYSSNALDTVSLKVPKNTHESQQHAAKMAKKRDIIEHTLSLPEILEKYNVSVLNEEEVVKRLAQYGSNKVNIDIKKRRWYFRLLDCLANLFNVILICAGMANLTLYLIAQEENFANVFLN